MSTQAPHTTHTAQQAVPTDFQRLQAAFLARGHHLHVSRDGFLAERWGLCRYLPTLADAQAFLKQIGGQP